MWYLALYHETIAERLRLATKAPKITLTFVGFATKYPHGVVNNLEVGVENCIVPIHFQILAMGSG